MFQLNDKLYNALKWLCLVALPAISVLYAALAGTWGLPYADKIPATIAAVQTFLGAVIGVSTLDYNKRNINE